MEPAVALLIGGPVDGKTIPLPEHWSHRLLVDPQQPVSIDEAVSGDPLSMRVEIHVYEWARYPAGWPKSKYTPFIHRGRES